MRQNRRNHRIQTSELLESRQLLSTTYFVDANAPGTTQNGASWETAYKDLQTILTSPTLLSGDSIKVADGTYKPTTTSDRTISFNLKNGVGIFGGYAGYGATDPNTRNTTLYPTTLSGDIGTVDDNTDNSYHVIFAQSVNQSAVLDGFTITLGNADRGGLNNLSYGGGIFSLALSSPTLTNCIFTRNSAIYGGGMYNTGSSSSVLSSPILTNCIFTKNFAFSKGGGLYNSLYSSPTLTNCTITGNSAQSYGGGIYNVGYSLAIITSPKLTNCSLIGNTAFYGGGVYNASYTSTKLTNCTIVENTTSGYGGSIYNYADTTPILTNCILWSNSSSIYNYYSTSKPTLSYCDIQNGYSGTGNINANPSFIRSPWTGPDSVWGTSDDDYGDLRLRHISPCLNAGLNSANSTSIDLAGNPRIQNTAIDMGVYEGSFTAPDVKTLYVDHNAAGINSGSSWANAFTSLQSALIAASDGDTIKVANGYYVPTTTTDRTFSFVLRNAISIYGGYAGCDAANPDARNTTLYPTILSGDIGNPGVTTDNSYHVVTACRIGASLLLDGLTITLGNANGDTNNQNKGGGMYIVSDSSPTLNHCVFIQNSSCYGGGIYNTSPSPLFTNCEFIGNSVYSTSQYSYGGGIYNYYSSATLINCTFTGNTAFSSEESYGGGMHNEYSSPTLVNCTFISNAASNAGGIYNRSSSSPKLINCILWLNGASPIIGNSSTPNITYSNIEGGFLGTGNINADPCFIRSPWTGPDGVFGTFDDDCGDLRLKSDSPCLNVGLNSENASSIDMAGNPRIQNDTIDLGPYEGAFAAPIPKTLFVDINAAGNNSGSSWTNAFTSLQSAMLAAEDGDTIKVADGIYQPTAATDRNISFALRNKVSLYGSFAGFGATDPDVQSTTLYPTILSGDIGIVGANTDNSFHILAALGVGSSTVLDGVTITLGYADGTGTNKNVGGGMLSLSSQLTLIHCAFVGNYASESGGGMYNSNSSALTILNCVFSGNSSNSVKTSYVGGGGLCNDHSSATLTQCTFIGNQSTWNGGGLYCLNYSSATLNNCVFSNNIASFGAGLYDDNYSSSNAINCSFVANIATNTETWRVLGGGGFYAITYSTAFFTNCTFTANNAYTGGVICNNSSAVTLTNCILWNNGATPIQEYYLSGSNITTITYSDFESGHAGTGNLNSDPLFVRNPSPGLDGKWGSADDDYGDLHLQLSSPCINAGLNSANTATTDLDGNPRIIDSTIDMGVHESPIPSFSGNNFPYQISQSNGQILLFDSAGQPLARYSASTLNLSNIQSLQIQNASADNLSISPSLLTLNSANINISGAAALSLANPALNSIALTGNVTLKLANPNLVVNTGSIPTLRQYLANAAVGAKPSIVCDSASTLALLDNSKLHKTSFAGQVLSDPFCQVLIQPAIPGDANLDGVVNQDDLLAIYANLGKTSATWLEGDLDQNGTVELADLALVQARLSSPLVSGLKVQKKTAKAVVFRSRPAIKHKIHKKQA